MSDIGKVNDLLVQIFRGEKKGLLFVYLWNLLFCGDIDMCIVCDGIWFYLGMLIGCKLMVKLFFSIICCDGDDYFLVILVEKVGICVDDVFFVVVILQVQGEGGVQVLCFVINVEDEVEVDVGYLLCVEIDFCIQEFMFYLWVCDNFEVLVYCNVFYQLVELVVLCWIDGIEWFGVWSYGEFFFFGLQLD